MSAWSGSLNTEYYNNLCSLIILIGLIAGPWRICGFKDACPLPAGHSGIIVLVTPYMHQRVVAVKAQRKKQALDYSSGLEKPRAIQLQCQSWGTADYLVDGCDASLNPSGDSHR
jgi:hypothetical protein